MDAITAKWVRNRSDELAVDAGCIFDEDRGNEVCDWIESHCHLYEGSNAPMILGDWQREATMRMFGWVKRSDRLGRWVRRFTQASVFVPKKNAKSPTAAAWALYLLCGDGEPGNHVFFVAADGGQARIAAKHALQMIRASPLLDAEQGGCVTVNLNEMRFTHLPSNSDAKPLSSGDNRAARAKQGLNGCIVVDEVHVVNKQFISESSIDKAGASRDEPFHIEVSTAGKDPDGYGKSRYDYGKMVECGEVEDQRLFFLCYEAPQGLSDEDLAADPIKYGRMANPTWGRIIQEDEYLADYNYSKRSLADLADFKTFRLNIWQSAASPWIRAHDWDACRTEYTERDLEGCTCCAGLDLAITRDMSALSFVFPWEDDSFRVLVYFFMPEYGIRSLALAVPRVLEWVRDGYIIQTSEQTTDYRVIKRFFAEKSQLFRINQLAYDERFADQLTLEMFEETGVERLRFFQNFSKFNEPTQNMERAILDRKFQHNGNPVLSWEMGHVNIEERHGSKRPVKPHGQPNKKIDGVVATIMGYAAARLTSGDEAWYKPGSLRD